MGGDERRELLLLGLKNYALYKEGKSETDAETFANNNIEDFASKPIVGYDQSGKPIKEWTDWKSLSLRRVITKTIRLA